MVLLVLVPGSVSLDNRLNRSILLCLFLLQDLYASTKFRLIWSEFWSIRISPNFLTHIPDVALWLGPLRVLA
jgi:hypothetical protein